MKRRRRYGEKYSGLPYPEDFKRRMMALFPNSEKLKEALDGGWESVGRWFDELCSYRSTVSVEDILDDLGMGEEGILELKQFCEDVIERQQALRTLNDEWQRIVFLDDQCCRSWKEKA